MSFYLRVLWIIICMYVCNTVKMQMKKIKIKNLLCLSFHMLCSQNFFYWIVFSLWLVLLVWLSNFMSEQLGVSNRRLFLQPPLNFQKRKANIWLLCHFLFYSRFCISAPTPVTVAAIDFLKRGRVVIFIYINYFILSLFSILICMHL